MQFRPKLETPHINQPMAEDDIKNLLMHGYEILGRLPIVRHQGGIATADNPDGERVVEPCTVWVQHPTIIPAGQVAQVLLASGSKDELCENLFGMTLEELQELMEEQKNA